MSGNIGNIGNIGYIGYSQPQHPADTRRMAGGWPAGAAHRPGAISTG